MKEAVIYTRYSSKPGLDRDGQREEILARFGGEYEIVGEYRDVASGTQEIQERPGINAMLDAVAKGEVEAFVCSDITRLTRSLSLEIIGALQKAGFRSWRQMEPRSALLIWSPRCSPTRCPGRSRKTRASGSSVASVPLVNSVIEKRMAPAASDWKTRFYNSV